MEEETSSKSKRASLCKDYETLRSEASLLHSLSLRWKDFDEHFNATRDSLEQRLGALVELGKSFEARERDLVAKESFLNSEIESKSKRLGEIETLIEERGTEIELKSKRLDETERLIKERDQELESKEREIASKMEELGKIERVMEERGKELESSVSNSKRLDDIERTIEECGKLLESNKKESASLESLICEKRHEVGRVDRWLKEKERNYDRLRSDIRERTAKLDSLDRCIGKRSEQVRSVSQELDLVQGKLKHCRDELDYKDCKFRSIQMSINECNRELESKENRLNEFDREIKVREETLYSIKDSIVKCSIQLELKKEQLYKVQQDFDLKKKIFVSLKKSADECVNRYDMRERQLEDLVLNTHKLKEQPFSPEFEEIHSIYKKVNECLEEVEFKERSLHSFQRLVEDQAIRLENSERRFEERVSEFKLRELDLIQNSTNIQSREKTNTFFSRIECVPSFVSYQYCTTNGHFLQLLVTEQLKRHDERCSELFAVLQGSPDPAKLVLDAIQDFYPLNLSSEEMGFDLSIVRTSCIILLEKLMNFSPEIGPLVRTEAITLARDWKAKMAAKTDNRLEIMGFLQLIASYRLVSAFGKEEIQGLADVIDQNRPESPFCRALAITNKAPVEPEQAETSKAILPNYPDFNAKEITHDDIFASLQMPDPAKHVLSIMNRSYRELWGREDHVCFAPSFMNSYKFVFEKLLRKSPEIHTDVKEDAMKLAIQWGDRIRASKTEMALEVLSFLLFLAAYGLVPWFTEDDIASFLELISLNRHVLGESRILGLAYKIDVYIQNLVGRKRLVAAVRVTCAFRLKDVFSPRKLLAEHVEELKSCSVQLGKKMKSVEEKDEVTDGEIASLRSVIQCVEDYNLNSEYPTDSITKRIGILENIKTNRKHSALFFQATDEQQQPLCNKRKDHVNSASCEQGQTKKKCLGKVATLSDKLCESPSPVSKPVPSPTRNLSIAKPPKPISPISKPVSQPTSNLSTTEPPKAMSFEPVPRPTTNPSTVKPPKAMSSVSKHAPPTTNPSTAGPPKALSPVSKPVPSPTTTSIAKPPRAMTSVSKPVPQPTTNPSTAKPHEAVSPVSKPVSQPMAIAKPHKSQSTISNHVFKPIANS